MTESMDEYEETRVVAYAMIKRGTVFVRTLGEALCVADCGNRQRIKEAFPELWATYLKKSQEPEP